MSSKTIGLYKNYPVDQLTIPARRSRNPIYLLRWARWFKANPRSERYMRELFTERYPDGEFIDVEAVNTNTLHGQINAASNIVLLYPDAIGSGFGVLERRVLRACNPMTGVRVLNGRRREFVLSRCIRRNLVVRRFLETTMLPELIAGTVLLLVTPLLLAIDLLRGRK